MDPFCLGPICIGVSLEIGGVLLAAVAGIATLVSHNHHKARHAQRERHHRERLTGQDASRDEIAERSLPPRARSERPRPTPASKIHSPLLRGE